MQGIAESRNLIGSLIALRNRATSTVNYSVLLMQHFFTKAELTDPNYNLFGVNPRGSQASEKLPLDPLRIEQIKYLVDGVVQGTYDQKTAQSGLCKKATNKKIWELKKFK